MTKCQYRLFGTLLYIYGYKDKNKKLNNTTMFESFFGGNPYRGNRRSLKEMMDELNEMFGEHPLFKQFESMESKTENGNDENGEWETQTFKSPDGTFTYIVTTSTYGSPKGKSKKNGPEKGSLESLKQQLEDAVKKEDFHLAIYLRDKIKNYEKDQEEIKTIENELKECIEKQEFEKAIELRDQLRKKKP